MERSLAVTGCLVKASIIAHLMGKRHDIFHFPVPSSQAEVAFAGKESREQTEVRAFKLLVNLNLQRTVAEVEVWVCTGPVGASRSIMQADVSSEGKWLHSPDGQGAWHLPSTCFLTVSAPLPHTVPLVIRGSQTLV